MPKRQRSSSSSVSSDRPARRQMRARHESSSEEDAVYLTPGTEMEVVEISSEEDEEDVPRPRMGAKMLPSVSRREGEDEGDQRPRLRPVVGDKRLPTAYTNAPREVEITNEVDVGLQPRRPVGAKRPPSTHIHTAGCDDEDNRPQLRPVLGGKSYPPTYINSRQHERGEDGDQDDERPQPRPATGAKTLPSTRNYAPQPPVWTGRAEEDEDEAEDVDEPATVDLTGDDDERFSDEDDLHLYGDQPPLPVDLLSRVLHNITHDPFYEFVEQQDGDEDEQPPTTPEPPAEPYNDGLWIFNSTTTAEVDLDRLEMFAGAAVYNDLPPAQPEVGEDVDVHGEEIEQREELEKYQQQDDEQGTGISMRPGESFEDWRKRYMRWGGLNLDDEEETAQLPQIRNPDSSFDAGEEVEEEEESSEAEDFDIPLPDNDSDDDFADDHGRDRPDVRERLRKKKLPAADEKEDGEEDEEEPEFPVSDGSSSENDILVKRLRASEKPVQKAQPSKKMTKAPKQAVKRSRDESEEAMSEDDLPVKQVKRRRMSAHDGYDMRKENPPTKKPSSKATEPPRDSSTLPNITKAARQTMKTAAPKTKTRPVIESDDEEEDDAPSKEVGTRSPKSRTGFSHLPKNQKVNQPAAKLLTQNKSKSAIKDNGGKSKVQPGTKDKDVNQHPKAHVDATSPAEGTKGTSYRPQPKGFNTKKRVIPDDEDDDELETDAAPPKAVTNQYLREPVYAPASAGTSKRTSYRAQLQANNSKKRVIPDDDDDDEPGADSTAKEDTNHLPLKQQPGTTSAPNKNGTLCRPQPKEGNKNKRGVKEDNDTAGARPTKMMKAQPPKDDYALSTSQASKPAKSKATQNDRRVNEGARHEMMTTSKLNNQTQQPKSNMLAPKPMIKPSLNANLKGLPAPAIKQKHAAEVEKNKGVAYTQSEKNRPPRRDPVPLFGLKRNSVANKDVSKQKDASHGQHVTTGILNIKARKKSPGKQDSRPTPDAYDRRQDRERSWDTYRRDRSHEPDAYFRRGNRERSPDAYARRW